MQIRISHPSLTEDLVAALNAADCVAARMGADAVDVVLPWVEREGDPAQGRMELLFFLKAWGSRHRGFSASLLGG